VAKRAPELRENDDLYLNLRREDLVESQLKQMINTEDKKRLFLILRRDIKRAINSASIIISPISRIDVTLKDDTVVAETKKEGWKSICWNETQQCKSCGHNAIRRLRPWMTSRTLRIITPSNCNTRRLIRGMKTLPLMPLSSNSKDGMIYQCNRDLT
jgi:hypothetical protein